MAVQDLFQQGSARAHESSFIALGCSLWCSTDYRCTPQQSAGNLANETANNNISLRKAHIQRYTMHELLVRNERISITMSGEDRLKYGVCAAVKRVTV